MLKFREIIRRMTLKQKVNVLTSNKYLETMGLDQYDIPSFNIVKSNSVSYKVLAQTWDEELIGHLAYDFANKENKNKTSKDLYNVPCFYNSWVDCFSEDPYQTGKLLSAYGKGLVNGGVVISYGKVPALGDSSLRYYREEELLPLEMAVKSFKPHAVIASNASSLDSIKSIGFDNALLVENDSLDDNFSFLFADFVFDEANDIALDLFNSVVKHKEAKSKLRSGEFNIEQFNEFCLINNAIDEKVLDEKINRFLELLQETKPNKISVNQVFTDTEVSQMYERLAKESIILLKNSLVLPIERHKKVALIGKYAKDIGVLDMIGNYSNEVIGFAYGYMGEETDDNLVNLANELAKNADVALVFLHNYGKSMDNQLALIDSLHANNVKIIAVVSSMDKFDMSFEEKCEAVILSKQLFEYEAKTTLDVVFGLVNPSGKLTETISSDFDEFNYKAYEAIDKKVIYPFGHGLSYSLFSYSNLEINEEGVTLTVSNVSDVDGYEIIQLYVGKEKSVISRNKKDLRGFAKVFVKAKDSMKVCIPFDDFTFAYFSENKNTWDIEEGEYQIYIGSSSLDIKIEASFEIIFNKKNIENEVIDNVSGDSLKKFTYDESNKILNDNKSLSFTKKLLLTIGLMLFVDSALIITCLDNYLHGDSYTLHLLLIILIVLFNGLAVFYVIYSYRKKTPKEKEITNDELSKMLCDVNEFNDLGTITYEIPVLEEKEEEIIEDEVVEEEKEEEIIEEVVESLEEDEEVEAVYNYANMVSYETVDEKRTINKVDFEKLCDRLIRYAHSFGIIVDPKSIRLLLAAMASSQLIVVSSPAKDLVVPFLDIVGKFFGDESFIFDTSLGSDEHSILWNLNEATGIYEQTDVSKVITKAFAIKKTMHTCTLTNVKYDLFKESFSKVIAWANNPASTVKIKINENQIYSLGKNLWFFICSDEQLPLDIAKCVMNISLSLRETTDVIEFNSQTGITYPDFVLNLSAAKELYYISEENWKRIDEFYDCINEHEKFVLGNKQVLQMEAFTSCYMSCNALEDEALDMVFVSKLVPMLKYSKVYNEENGEVKLVEYINRSFGNEDSLVQTQKLLKSKINY